MEIINATKNIFCVKMTNEIEKLEENAKKKKLLFVVHLQS